MRTLQASLLAGAVASIFASAAACSDSLHLDPGAGGSTAAHMATITSGSAGGGPMGCDSNANCPYPTAVCDTIQGICVECLVEMDCQAKPGTVCSKGACACPTKGESFCDATTGSAARCADLQTATNDCGTCGHACFGGCVAGKCSDPWEPTQVKSAPDPRQQHVAVWTGKEMVVWGGKTPGGVTSTGGVYDPATGKWRPTSLANAPTARYLATAVWTGSVMIVFGGLDGANNPVTGGGQYDPAKNTWATLPLAGAPSPRYSHVAAWADDKKKMVIWGGNDGMGAVDSGGVFDPTTGSWTSTTTLGAPSARQLATAVYSLGAASPSMIVFGGQDGMGAALSDGGKFDPGANQWSSLPPTGPSARANHTAVWTGVEMLVFGGTDDVANQYLGDGSKYSDPGNQWSPMNPGPDGRAYQTAAWLGSAMTGQMIIFSGANKAGIVPTSWSFNTAQNLWTPIPSGPEPRVNNSLVVDGAKIIVWGGSTAAGITNTGGVFDTAFK